MCGCKGGSKGSTNYVYGLGMESFSIPPNGGYMADTQSCSDSNFVKIVYRGSIGNHVVYSPLKKISSYGMHTDGDVFCVHFDDAAAAPTIFVLTNEAPNVPPPVTPPPPSAPEIPEPVAPVDVVDPEPVAKKESPAHTSKKGSK